MAPYIRLLLLISWIGMSASSSHCQERQIAAYRTEQKITIDGKFDDWPAAAPIATDFVQFEPNPGADATYPTHVQIAYDDNALYFKAILQDTTALIRTDLTARDNLGNADWFGVFLDPYNNGITGVAFIVTASGVQFDSQWSGDDEDANWDAVWSSRTQVTQDGWQLEMSIPYAALRFGDGLEQDWLLQLSRYTRRSREYAHWNRVDPNETGILRQSGTLQGLKDIKSPLRLSLTPFVVGNHANQRGNTSSNISAGMDLKYGLNEAFTLDMTLIPDFSQVQADDVVVNLSAFEQFFEERRQFFTEGTELFSRGDIFYSRRVGGSLFYRSDLAAASDSLTLLNVPTNTRLLNASKVSGRFENGSGLGVFNAIEGREIVNAVNQEGEITRLRGNPLTNYNVIVYDHVMKNNSYVSLINTNVLREGSATDANVTGTEFQLRDKAQKWEISGNAAVSQRINALQRSIGHKVNVNLGDIQGKWTKRITYTEESDTYNPNDLGFLFSGNERSIEYYMEYNDFEQSQRLNRWRYWYLVNASGLYQPNVYTGSSFEMGGFWFTRKFFAFGFASGIFHNFRNYFEPRTSDFSQFWDSPNGMYIQPFISTDYSKPVALDVRINSQYYFNNTRRSNTLTFSPRWQINSSCLIIASTRLGIIRGRDGYIDKALFDYASYGLSDSSVTFGLRNRNTVTNSLRLNYIFTNRMSLDLRVRHYWDAVEYDDYLVLEDDGSLRSIDFDGLNSEGKSIYQINNNIFNVDLNYYWRFLPGSDIIFSYKNNAFTDALLDGYSDNLASLFQQKSNHFYSLKILYFLDVGQSIKTIQRQSRQ